MSYSLAASGRSRNSVCVALFEFNIFHEQQSSKLWHNCRMVGDVTYAVVLSFCVVFFLDFGSAYFSILYFTSSIHSSSSYVLSAARHMDVIKFNMFRYAANGIFVSPSELRPVQVILASISFSMIESTNGLSTLAPFPLPLKPPILYKIDF